MRIRGARTSVPFALGGSADERSEERMRRERLGLEFRMELATEKPRMIRRLDNFHINAIGRLAADFEARSSERLFIIAIKFVAMAVTFRNFRRSVGARRKRTLLQFARPRS